jgi:hypothetical protein
MAFARGEKRCKVTFAYLTMALRSSLASNGLTITSVLVSPGSVALGTDNTNWTGLWYESEMKGVINYGAEKRLEPNPDHHNTAT